MREASTEFAARRIRVAIAGGEVALLRFGREGAPPFLFAHANGFCASAYRRMFDAMGGSFDIFAADLRGHGRTRLEARTEGHRSMAIFGDDLRLTKEALSRFAGAKRWTLAGHSLGAVAVLMAAVDDDTIAAVRLIEPVAPPRLWNVMARSWLWPLITPHIPLVKAASRRRDRWPDRAAALAGYAQKPFFAGWAAGVLADYLEDGLTPTGEGVRLSCPPAWEAANFSAQANDLYGAMKRIAAPVRILAALDPSSTLRGDSMARFRRLGAHVERRPGVTHLIPFEAPDLAATFLMSSD